MGKHEVGTPKYIANKIKAKGLQKLRWYCQMCQKQCRDENGFKCHTMSESHHRQLLLFADNASRYMDQFSREFSEGYVNLLQRQFGTTRVAANRVYQEYIADRNHVHMNATMWLSLTAFVKWLGRSGKCVVDETEKGWYVTYIDRGPETLAAQEKKEKKEKMDKDDEERMMAFIEKQVEKGRMEDPAQEESDSKTPLIRSEDDAPVVITLKVKPKPVTLASTSEREKKAKPGESSKTKEPKREVEVKEEEDEDQGRTKKKPKQEAQDRGWLREGLTVKVTTRRLGDKYYKAKGVVQAPVESSGYVAKVKLQSPEEVRGHLVKLDQEYVETVIPAIGREVLLLWGKHRDSSAVVKKVRFEEFCVDVEVRDSGELLKRIPYEQVCKFSGNADCR